MAEFNLIVNNFNQTNESHVNSLDRYINKKKKVNVQYVKRIVKTTTTKEVNHEVITYLGKQYIVCCIPFNETHKMFLVDFDDKDKVVEKTWHYRSDGSYIASSHEHEESHKELYLHNFVMNKLTFDGKGQQHTIDHINRIGTDNRKLNLREVSSQSAQNFNQKKRERTTELPLDSNIDINMIPKNIYYGKPSGAHGDFFYIELKSIPSLCIEGKKYNWKSTKSKNVSLNIKLQQTIDKLNELKNTYPELENIIIDNVSENIRMELTTEYNNILRCSHYPQYVIDQNIILMKTDNIISNIVTDIPDINELNMVKTVKNAGRKSNNLPSNCSITIESIPKYCYFKPESEKRGCKFVIDKHPKLVEQGIRQWTTTESKNLTIEDKFKLLNDKLNELI